MVEIGAPVVLDVALETLERRELEFEGRILSMAGSTVDGSVRSRQRKQRGIVESPEI